MKKKSTSLIALVLVLVLAVFAPAVRGQVFYGGITVIGTSNAPVLSNFITVTNSAFSTLPARTLVIQNLISNSTVNCNYGYQWSGFGGTNLLIANTFTTNFNGAGLTNGSTVYITLPSSQNTVNLTPWGTYQCTNSSGNVTNIVSLF